MWQDAALYSALERRLLSEVLVAVWCHGKWSGSAISVGPTSFLTCRHVVSRCCGSPQEIELVRHGKVCARVLAVRETPKTSKVDAVLLLTDRPLRYAKMQRTNLRDSDSIVLAWVDQFGDAVHFTSGIMRGYDHKTEIFCVEGAPTEGGESGGVAVLLRGDHSSPVSVLFVGMHIGRNDNALGMGVDMAEFVAITHALEHMPHPSACLL